MQQTDIRCNSVQELCTQQRLKDSFLTPYSQLSLVIAGDSVSLKENQCPTLYPSEISCCHSLQMH
jgi:hypothetical protein